MTHGRYWSGASGLTYDDGFYYNATSNRLGIGPNTPSGALHRERHHLPRRHDQQQHNPAHAVRTLLGLDCRKCGCNDRPTACARRRLQTVPDDVDGPGFDIFPTALVEYTGNRRPIADGKRWFCGYRYESPERDPQCDRQQLGRGRNGGMFTNYNPGVAETAARIYLTTGNGVARGAYIEAINTAGAANAHALAFGTNTNTNTTAPAERMRIDKVGNVRRLAHPSARRKPGAWGDGEQRRPTSRSSLPGAVGLLRGCVDNASAARPGNLIGRTLLLLWSGFVFALLTGCVLRCARLGRIVSLALSDFAW